MHLEHLCRRQSRRHKSDHLHACVRSRRLTGCGRAAGRDRAPRQARVVVMAAGVHLGTHRTGGVRHEVLGTAGNGAPDVRGCDIAAHACIGHHRARKIGVLTACRSCAAKGGALTATKAETGWHVEEPAPSRPCWRSKEASKHLEGHGAGSCSDDLHGHRKCARCKERAPDCLVPKCLSPNQQCKARSCRQLLACGCVLRQQLLRWLSAFLWCLHEDVDAKWVVLPRVHECSASPAKSTIGVLIIRIRLWVILYKNSKKEPPN